MNLFKILTKSNKNETAKYLEECLTDLVTGEDKNKTFKSIKNTLNNLTDDICDDIYIGKKSSQFYGMSVYLSTNDLDKLAKDIMNNETTNKEITKALINRQLHYVIEIDPNILNPIYKFSPAELTAILLHEVGHVTADSDFYNDLKESYNKALYGLTNDQVLSVNDDTNNGNNILCILYILSSIQQTHVSKYGNDIIKEEIADKFVVEMGYGVELQSIIDKFSKLYKSRYVRKNIDDITDSEAKTFMHLITVFKQRRDYVTDLLNTEAKMNISTFISNVLSDSKDKLSKLLISESYSKYSTKIMNETFLDIFNRDPIKVSQNDIDQLKIELEMMEDYDDKSVIVYKIHKRITQLTVTKGKLDQNARTFKYNNNLIESYINQLQKLLNEAMKFKVIPKTYGVFVKYPKGYEG